MYDVNKRKKIKFFVFSTTMLHIKTIRGYFETIRGGPKHVLYAEKTYVGIHKIWR